MMNYLKSFVHFVEKQDYFGATAENHIKQTKWKSCKNRLFIAIIWGTLLVWIYVSSDHTYV